MKIATLTNDGLNESNNSCKYLAIVAEIILSDVYI